MQMTMKKPILLTLLPLTLIACQDESTKPSSPIADNTFDASSGLELYYNGVSMPGKTVKFSQTGNKAEITAYSRFDLSQLSALGLSGEVPAPGIVPGSPQLILSAVVVPSDGGWSFTGNSANEYCKFSYSGFATPDKLKLYISDATLSTPISPEVWRPAPLEKSENGSIKSSPFYIDWQYSPLPDVDIDFSGILSALTTLPVIPVYGNTAYMSVSQALSEVLQTVAFKSDGNIIFTYINDSFGATRIDQTQPNGYQYVIDSPSSVKLYVNPLSFFGLLLNNTSGGTPASDVDLNAHGLFPANGSNSSTDHTSGSFINSEIGKQVLKSVMQVLLPQLATGIPLSFDIIGNELHLFIDTKTTLTLIQKIILPLLQDSPTVKAIIEYISSSPTLKPILPDLQKGFELLPKALEATNTMRLGFSFVPYSK